MKRILFNRQSILGLALFAFLAATGCVRTTNIPMNQRMLETHPLTREAAIQKLVALSEAVKSLQASVTFEASIGGLNTSSRKDFPSLDGRLLIQRPDNIQIRARYGPVTAFDMISDGMTYQFYVPLKNRLYRGEENGPPVAPISDDALVNVIVDLRPKQVDAALVTDVLPLVNNSDIRIAVESYPVPQDRRRYYIVDFFSIGDEQAHIVEKIWFDLSTPDSDIARKQVFAPNGDILTDVKYTGYERIRDSEIRFPSLIEIQFPAKDVVLKIAMDPEEITLNGELPEAAFQSDHPGAELIVLKGEEASNVQ